MIDEGFHLTPVDVRRADFGQAFRGYDREKVEEFRTQVADELERLTRLNQELDSKARGFHEQLRAFRERDKALNDALVTAQQLRSEIREQAEREGQLVIREAQAEANRIVEGAHSEIGRLEQERAQLERSLRVYINQLRALVQRQLAELEAAEPAASRLLEPLAPEAPAAPMAAPRPSPAATAAAGNAAASVAPAGSAPAPRPAPPAAEAAPDEPAAPESPPAGATPPPTTPPPPAAPSRADHRATPVWLESIVKE